MTGQQPPRSELRLFLALFCLCALQSVSGFPQPLLKQMDGPDIPKIERLALCFSQWTALSNRPQISNFVMNRCSSIFNSMQVNEQNNQEIYKRFLFHYSRAQEPTYPLKTGDSSGTMGRPFFLFRARNGRGVEEDQ
ncbi:neuromedin-S isoform X3 [Pleurodeles waltl]|uniref:neuromedin-S isoform X3 n=1 Tax=Pleurodeles waltl TaxID=8319 RepID=UPI003709703F